MAMADTLDSLGLGFGIAAGPFASHAIEAAQAQEKRDAEFRFAMRVTGNDLDAGIAEANRIAALGPRLADAMDIVSHRLMAGEPVTGTPILIDSACQEVIAQMGNSGGWTTRDIATAMQIPMPAAASRLRHLLRLRLVRRARREEVRTGIPLAVWWPAPSSDYGYREVRVETQEVE